MEWNTKLLVFKRAGAEALKEMRITLISLLLTWCLCKGVYQFKDYRSVLNNMFEAARELLIVSEPVKNMSQSENKIIQVPPI